LKHVLSVDEALGRIPDELVSKEQIEAIIEAGTWAPTGMNRQPWKFIVIQNKQSMKGYFRSN